LTIAFSEIVFNKDLSVCLSSVCLSVCLSVYLSSYIIYNLIRTCNYR